MKIGYARVSTAEQDLQSQREKLVALGVDPTRIYCDHGFSGKKMTRDGLEKALEAVREGDTFVVTAMDRLARNVKGAFDILDALEKRGIGFSVGDLVHDPKNPHSTMFMQILAVVANAEGGWIANRTAEAMKRPDVRARLRARPPRHDADRDADMLDSYENSDKTVAKIAKTHRTSRATVYRALDRARAAREATNAQQTDEPKEAHRAEGAVSRSLK
jgi:DNA invertase Pin-like site-specific DNA recombinase